MDLSNKVDVYIAKNKKFKSLLNQLRVLLLKTELKETVKWGMPTYTLRDKNLIGLGGFKNHVSLWFFQGALLKDGEKILNNAQEGKTNAMRQIKFINEKDIDENVILNYIYEAIENHKNGKEIKPQKNTRKIILSKELKDLFIKDNQLKNNFDALTTGKKRDYIDFINDAKKESTKIRRLEKIIPLIKEGKGLYDKYKNC